MDIQKMLGKDDWHLCEGLLTIYMNSNMRQTVIFNDGKRDSYKAYGNKDTILDLGSCKETISIFNSQDTSKYDLSKNDTSMIGN